MTVKLTHTYERLERTTKRDETAAETVQPKHSRELHVPQLRRHTRVKKRKLEIILLRRYNAFTPMRQERDAYHRIRVLWQMSSFVSETNAIPAFSKVHYLPISQLINRVLYLFTKEPDRVGDFFEKVFFPLGAICVKRETITKILKNI